MYHVDSESFPSASCKMAFPLLLLEFLYCLTFCDYPSQKFGFVCVCVCLCLCVSVCMHIHINNSKIYNVVDSRKYQNQALVIFI